jgi:phosphoribosylamine-glycine ligase
MRYVTLEESKLAQAVLAPLEAALIRSGYTGYIDVAVIIDKKGNVCPLEFTSRLGWPLFQIQQVLHKDVAQWMLDLINGKDTFRPFTDIALGVVIAIPDYPYKYLKIEELCGYPIWGITDKNRYNIHPSDIMLGQGYGDNGLEDMMVTAGNNPVIVTGTGNGVCEAKDAAYETVKELEIPNSPMYRTDIGDRLENQLEELQSMGYATSWNWK